MALLHPRSPTKQRNQTKQVETQRPKSYFKHIKTKKKNVQTNKKVKNNFVSQTKKTKSESKKVKNRWEDIENTTLLLCAAPPGGGRNQMTARFTRHSQVRSLFVGDWIRKSLRIVLSGFAVVFSDWCIFMVYQGHLKPWKTKVFTSKNLFFRYQKQGFWWF